jgi:hypothetical protein
MLMFRDRFIGGPQAEKIKVNDGSFFVRLGNNGPLITNRTKVDVNVQPINKDNTWLISAGNIDFLMLATDMKNKKFIIEAKKIRGKPRNSSIIKGKQKFTLFGKSSDVDDSSTESENIKLMARIQQLESFIASSGNLNKEEMYLLNTIADLKLRINDNNQSIIILREQMRTSIQPKKIEREIPFEFLSDESLNNTKIHLKFPSDESLNNIKIHSFERGISAMEKYILNLESQIEHSSRLSIEFIRLRDSLVDHDTESQNKHEYSDYYDEWMDMMYENQ